MELRFSKDNGQWYIVLPYFLSIQGALAMVAGADTLLDYLSHNKKGV